MSIVTRSCRLVHVREEEKERERRVGGVGASEEEAREGDAWAARESLRYKRRRGRRQRSRWTGKEVLSNVLLLSFALFFLFEYKSHSYLSTYLSTSPCVSISPSTEVCRPSQTHRGLAGLSDDSRPRPPCVVS